MFVIEKNIPAPKRRGKRGAGKTTKYPFDKMYIGDSFLILWADMTCTYNGLRGGVGNTAFRSGIKVVTEKQKEGLRVWRVK